MILNEKEYTIEAIHEFKSKGGFLDQIDRLEIEVSKCLIENQIDLTQFFEKNIKSKMIASNYFNFNFRFNIIRNK